ncbi:MAG: hypothetical protein N2383_00275 [Caldilineales bacterium]|nr:hypothetical protein [Caldilineales bacterium]
MEEALRQFSAQTFQISGRFILFLIFLGIAGYCRRILVSGRKDYGKMFTATAPSLKEGPSPFDVVISGTTGCFRAIIGFVLIVLFLTLAFDVLLDFAILSALLAQIP